MIVSTHPMTPEERQQLRDSVHRVPAGMTADEAMERRMTLLRFSERRPSRNVRIAVLAGVLALGAITPWLAYTLGA